MIFKVALDKKIRLINLKGKESIDELRTAVSQSFKMPADSFEMSYIDEDGDKITLSDPQDFSILISSEAKTTKIKIQMISDFDMNDSHDISYSQMVRFEIAEQANKKEELGKENEEEKPKPLSYSGLVADVLAEEAQGVISLDEVEPEPVAEANFEIKEEVIEEKFKKLLPGIISKVKAEIQEEILQRSKIYQKVQPVIKQEEPEIIEKILIKYEEPVIIEKIKTVPEPQTIPSGKNKPVVHGGVTCDGCRKKDIEGARFKCAVCADFDFCEECERTIDHPHPMLKIKNLRQTPLKMFTIINDEDNNLEVNGHKIPAQVDVQSLIQKGLGFMTNLMMSRQGGNQGRPQCPYFMNNFRCQREAEKKEEKPIPEQKPKMEEKIETKEKSVPVVPKEEQKASQDVSEDKIIDVATYLSEFDFEFEKCYQWARTYSKLSKEELLNICLTNPSLLN